MKRIDFIRIIISLVVIVLLSLYGCGNSKEVEGKLSLAERLMESHPDSSLYILNGIDVDKLKGSPTKARYALLKSMALDKNYIDTTTFDVLQPAIDYYLKKGNADDKLRMFYYKGRIHRNAGDDDLAMKSYLSAFDIKSEVSDSLTLARLFVAQAAIFYKQYRLRDCINNNLNAAEIYKALDMDHQQLKSYLRALDGEIIINEKIKADSIFRICKTIVKNSPSLKKFVTQPFLRYYIEFGQKDDILECINENAGISRNIEMGLARAYSKIGDPKTGLRYLNEAEIGSDEILDSLTYWSVKTEILENMGDDKKALDAFRNYSRVLEIYHDRLFSNELLFSEKKHEMELESMGEIHRRDNIIKWILAGAAIMICVTGLVYYRYRLNKAGRLIAEQTAETLQLKNENLQLETEKLRLEAENMRLEIGQLEDERERLSGLLEQREELSDEARQLIRERIDMLNGLLARAITNEESYGKEFHKYVDKIRKDKKKFQRSIGKVLSATHPEFMKYLESHGLTEREIDYVCLYAIGLRGKEIGNYLDLARHYNISTEVRRKLGLDSNDPNLGPFIRKMMTGSALIRSEDSGCQVKLNLQIPGKNVIFVGKTEIYGREKG